MDLAFDAPLGRGEDPLLGTGARAANDGEPLEALRRLLKVETERLRIRHRFGLPGREIAAGRSHLVDLVVSRACRLAAAEVAPGLTASQDQIAVVAVGGYGRAELAPWSDVDLLFLHAERSDDDVKAVVERALALLWDAGLTVGHSFRSVRECVAMATADLHTRTALAESRLVAGSEPLYARMAERLDSLVFASARTTHSFLESLRADLAERREKYGHAVGLLEPHVKESAGGLRDLHAVLWVGHAVLGTRGLAALQARGAVSDAEVRAALRAYDHLCRIRNEAHFATGRKSDLLTLDLQPALAESLGYRPRRGLQPSELFMRDYYRRASELHRFAHAFLLRHAPPPARRVFSLALLRRRPRGTFEIRDGKVYARGPAAALGSARRLLEAFAIAQGEGPELSEELKLDIAGSLHLVDRAFRESAEASRALLRLLEAKGRVGPTLRALHQTGVLGRLMPEFARVTFLVQHDFYHRYTVDEHTLTAIDALDRVPASADPTLERFRRVLDDVSQPAVLYLGLLLHDIGKGHDGGHVARGSRIAQRVCARLRLGGKATEDVVFLVEAHLEMSQISQRRDLTDRALIAGFARRVGSLDRLGMLLLLTYADHCGVGPGIWNEWKGALLWDLYTRTRALLAEPDVAAETGSADARERAARQLAEEFAGSEVERHFALMPERYVRATDGVDMVRHFRLLHALGSRALAADWRTEAHCTDLVIAAGDHPGLLAQLAGTLTAQGLDILSVDVYTREDQRALDVFKVRTVGDHASVDPARWRGIEDALREGVEGRTDVAAAVEKRRGSLRRRPKRRALVLPTVRFDFQASSARTVVEVRAEDEPGLVFRIASVLSAHGCDIGFAKIATDKSHALDVFYVAGASGGPLDAEERARVGAAVVAALDPRRAHSGREEG